MRLRELLVQRRIPDRNRQAEGEDPFGYSGRSSGGGQGPRAESNGTVRGNNPFRRQPDRQICLILASTTGSGEERVLKEQIADFGWKAVATEVGGLAGDLPQKITRAVVGAALNGEIVRKNSNEMHALMHAAFEAMNGFISVGMLEASIGVKIGIVRNRHWVAVAVVGDTAYHAVAHHERCGLGVMHI
jgi:hut operon positive regulator